MAHQGWTGIIFDEEYGGLGLGLVEMAVALEEMGRALLPGPYLSTVLLAGVAIDAAGNPAQKRKYLSRICDGRSARHTGAAGVLRALGCRRRATRGAAHARGLRAERAENVRTGRRRRGLPGLRGAPWLRTSDCSSCRATAPGLTISLLPAIDETRKLYQVEFADVPVAEEDFLAIGDSARAALERALAAATVALAAEMVGGMQRVMEIAVEYAKARKQFGKPIGQFQAVQHLCADMLLLTESSRSAAYYAAWALQERVPEADAAVSIAKAYASDAYREVGNRGIQVQGGMGFTWENNVHLYYKRAKASELMFGDATYHRERIARLAIDKPADKL